MIYKMLFGRKEQWSIKDRKNKKENKEKNEGTKEGEKGKVIRKVVKSRFSQKHRHLQTQSPSALFLNPALQRHSAVSVLSLLTKPTHRWLHLLLLHRSLTEKNGTSSTIV